MGKYILKIRKKVPDRYLGCVQTAARSACDSQTYLKIARREIKLSTDSLHNLHNLREYQISFGVLQYFLPYLPRDDYQSKLTSISV